MFEVQHFTLCGWENVWTIDGQKEYFDSFADAEMAITDFLEDEQREYDLGNIESPYDREEFRIMEVKNDIG
jgi:hypothetical protein